MDIVLSDARVVDQMLGHGAEALRRCYQCGTCSVVCPRTPMEDAFPRKEMIWAQWGLSDRLLTDADAWLCYQCNDCITSCPVDARPGDVMAATRDLQIEEYAFPRFMARIPLHRRYLPLAVAIPAVLVVLLVLLGGVVAHEGPAVPEGDVLFERFIGHGWLDIFTLSLVAAVAVLAAVGLRRFWAGLQSSAPPDVARQPMGRALRGAAVEILTHEGFSDCQTSHFRRGAHLAIFYGFLGLVAATTGAAIYTEIFPLVGIDWQDNELSLPAWDPVKIVGNVGGVALLIGLGHTLLVRRRDPERSGKSAYSDWFFSGLLVLTAVSGFVTEILRYAEVRAAYPAYAVHLVFVYGLFIYLPFSKFSHLLYRTAAITFTRQIERRKGSAPASGNGARAAQSAAPAVLTSTGP